MIVLKFLQRQRTEVNLVFFCITVFQVQPTKIAENFKAEFKAESEFNTIKISFSTCNKKCKKMGLQSIKVLKRTKVETNVSLYSFKYRFLFEKIIISMPYIYSFFFHYFIF